MCLNGMLVGVRTLRFQGPDFGEKLKPAGVGPLVHSLVSAFTAGINSLAIWAPHTYAILLFDHVRCCPSQLHVIDE